jgi:hypothetical protein
MSGFHVLLAVLYLLKGLTSAMLLLLLLLLLMLPRPSGLRRNCQVPRDHLDGSAWEVLQLTDAWARATAHCGRLGRKGQ